MAPSSFKILAFLCLNGFGVLCATPAPTYREIVERSLPYLTEEAEWWVQENNCASCHHTALYAWVLNLAEVQGFEVQAERIRWNEWLREHFLSVSEESKDGKRVIEGNAEGASQLFLGQGNLQDQRLHDLVPVLLANQQPNGSWNPNGQLPAQKRPLVETREVSTMWIALGLSRIDPATTKSSLTLANAYPSLGPSDAKSTEWFAARIPFLQSQNLSTSSAMEDLLARQNSDGGWSWVDGDPSDALATGQALFGLSKAGMSLESPAIRKAVNFLGMTQEKAGSWPVKSTKAKSRKRVTRISRFFGSVWAILGILEVAGEN